MMSTPTRTYLHTETQHRQYTRAHILPHTQTHRHTGIGAVSKPESLTDRQTDSQTDRVID